MAILNSLINTGESRLLGKVYMNDLSLGSNLTVQGNIETEGTINIGKSTAANALIYLNNKLAIQGKDTWLRINEKVSGTQPFSSGVYFGNSVVRTDGTLQVGGSGGSSLNVTTSAIQLKQPTTISNTLIVTGATTLGTTSITTAAIGTANIQNANVYGTLRAAEYSIETLQNLGGHFLVCPTIEVPSAASGFSCQVTQVSSSQLRIAFTDNSLSTDTFNGTTWSANSKVKVSGMINNIAIGTCDGVIESWNKTSKVVTTLVTCDVASSFSTTATSFTSTQVKNLSIMMYEVYTNNTTYPIGIYLTAYGENKYSYIDVYGGTSSKPTTRMGKLDGLDAVNGTSPTGWGFYSSQNGYFQGMIVSSAGKIGNFNISSALYSGNHLTFDSANTGIYIGDTYIAGGSGATWWLKSDGSAKIGAMTLSSAGVLAVPAANITGTLSADRIGANTLTIGKFTTVDQEKILNENIEIGGRNLLRNSQSPSGTGTNWALYSNVTIEEEDGDMVIKWAQTSKNWNKLLFRPYISGNSIKGKTITISAEVRCHDLPSTATDAWFYLNPTFYNGVDDSTRSVYKDNRYSSSAFEENKWVKISVAYDVSETLSDWSIQNSSVDRSTNSNYFSIELYNYSAKQIDIKHVKLEYGNKATDWTPAPEDTSNYFFFDSSGAHIATVGGNGNSGYNSLWTSNGLFLRKDAITLAKFDTSAVNFYDGIGSADSNIVASFGSSQIVIGLTNATHFLFDYHSIQGLSKEGTTYFHVSDLRDATGVATMTEDFTWDGMDGPIDFSLSVVAQNIISITADGNSVTDYSFSETTVTINDTSSWNWIDNFKVKITYTTKSALAKAYTLGLRDSSESIGLLSIATGNTTSATGYTSTAFGSHTQAYGAHSIASGYNNQAQGVASFVGGRGSISNGNFSIAYGRSVYSGGIASAAFGIGTRAVENYSLVCGKYNNGADEALFGVGCGTSSNPKTAFFVTTNGRTIIGGESDYYGNMWVSGSITTAQGKTIYCGSSVYTGGKTTVTDGGIGAALGQNGHLYLSGETYSAIYFFRDHATSYTNYISEQAAGSLKVQHDLETGGTLMAGAVKNITTITWGTNQTPARYRCVVSAGICHFSMTGPGIAHTTSTLICTLPTEARPPVQINVPFVKMTGGVVGELKITTAGAVTVDTISSTTNTGRIYLNCSFPVV